MQTLGLSDSSTRSESRLKSLFWPSIQSGADVDYLAVQGFWVCTMVGALSFVFLALAHQPITGFLVFLLFHLGGVGVREHNPSLQRLSWSITSSISWRRWFSWQTLRALEL